MGIVISAYVQNAFCEFLLPAVNNTDTEIVLKKNIFAFPEDVVLCLEVVNKEWFFKKTDQYYITKQEGAEDSPLKNGDILTVHVNNGNKISLIILIIVQRFLPDSVPCQYCLILSAVIDSKCKHAV